MQKHVLQWHITHKCNLRCKHCYQDDYCNDLTFEQLENIFYKYIEFVNFYNFKPHINITGGEPFVHKDLFKLLDLLEENSVTFGILTNGTLITKQQIKKLSNYKMLSFVQVSIDGNKKTHEEIRGNGTFDKSMKCLKLLKKYNIQTMVSFTCHKQNYKQLEEVVEIIVKNKIDRFWSDRLIPIDDNKDISKSMILSDIEYLNYVITLRNLKKKYKNCETTIHMNRALQFYDGEPIYQCAAGKTLLTILANGNLLPCRRLPITLGNVINESIIDIYSNNETIKQLNSECIPDNCLNCGKSKQCKGGAKCLSYAMTGKLNEKDFNCLL